MTCEGVVSLGVSLLIFILITLVMNVVIARRGLGIMAWICVGLTLLAAITVVYQLQAMVPESWSLGLWIIGVTALMILVIPLPALGKCATVAKTVIMLLAIAYPVWLAAQMMIVYSAIQSEDPQTVRQHVDFEAMREGVEGQLSMHFDAVDASLAIRESNDEGLVAGVKSLFSSSARKSRRWLVRSLARNILTPAGLKKVLNQQPSGASGATPSWNNRLRIERVKRWKLWTNSGWIGFEPSRKGEHIQLRSIEFSQEVLDQIEKIEDGIK